MIIKIGNIKENYVSAIDKLREEHTKFINKVRQISYEQNEKQSEKYNDWIGKYFAIVDSFGITKVYGKIIQIRFHNFIAGDLDFPYFEDRLYIDYEREGERFKGSKTLTINLNSCSRCKDEIFISDDLESLKLMRECNK